jgi:hypothetical protein
MFTSDSTCEMRRRDGSGALLRRNHDLALVAKRSSGGHDEAPVGFAAGLEVLGFVEARER